MDGPKTKVLIADDDVGMLGMLTWMLNSMNIDVVEARNAVTALVLAHDARPDLIIMDIGMPCGNGLSACEMLTTEPDMAHKPVIILTGKSDQATLSRCHSLGAHYVQKGPEAVNDVKALLRRLLRLGGEASPTLAEMYVG